MIITLLYLFGQHVARYIIGYKAGESGISVRLFVHIPLLSIKYKDIADIRKVTSSELLDFNTFLTLRWGNRYFGEMVVIARKKWLLYRYLVITPDDADGFVFKVRQHLT